MHPLAAVVRSAMAGDFPPPDGRVERLPAWRSGIEATVSFTGHGYLCLGDDRPVPDDVTALAADAFGGVSDPRVVAALAGPDAGAHDIDSLDVLLVAPGIDTVDSPMSLQPRSDLTHPRIDYARRLRDDLRVLSPTDTDDTLLILGTGVAGLTEVSIEVAPLHRGTGLARSMVRAARSSVPPGEPLVAMIAPGNAASLRAFLAAGFTPVGSAHLWHRS